MSGFDEIFKAISHRTRREILTFLNERKSEVNSSEINRRFSGSWATLCNHLDLLVTARLVKKRKVGREVFYSLNSLRLRGAVKTWINSFD